MTLDEFNKTFKYTPDGKLDSWRILDESYYAGDCDDYAVTVAYIESGGLVTFLWNLLVFKMVFWFVWDANGESHVVLWVRGKGWIDNWYPSYSDKLSHKKRFPILFPMVLIKMLLGKFFK